MRCRLIRAPCCVTLTPPNLRTCADGVYRILYEEVDETHVEVLYLHTAHEGSEPEAIRLAGNDAIDS